jgi:hypothetical protein
LLHRPGGRLSQTQFVTRRQTKDDEAGPRNTIATSYSNADKAHQTDTLLAHSSHPAAPYYDRLLMQRAKRPQDTGRGDGCWIAIVDRAPSLRQPWLQYAVRSLRPCHQAHLERSSGGLRGRLRNRRWQAFARKDAVYAETGRTFDQLTAECCTTSDNPRGRHKTTDIPGDRQFAPC